MVLLYFMLDLRTLPLPILRDLKQSLLHLANYYAISSPKIYNSFDGPRSSSKPPLDRIGICYVSRNRISCSDELTVAYNPQGNFNLRDIHHALNNLPTDAFSPESNNSETLGSGLILADVLSDKFMYSLGGQDKNIARKVISISSCVAGTLDSMTVKALMDAADKNISVEFIFVERASNHLGDISDQIRSLKNCSFQTCVPDLQVLYVLVKRWLRELMDDRDEPLQATLVFKTNLINTMNHITCNLWTSFNPMVDEFHFCQTCRCHGLLMDHSNMKPNRSACPVTNDDLGDFDINENSVRVGEHTILYMPSFQDTSKLNQVSSPIDFNVIQRTNLGSLSEGLITGPTYFITPSTLYNSDDNKDSDQNSQLFQGVCGVLNSLDQGLVCSSTFNIETGKETSFQCYYILLPSDKGLMLLRRLLALEEFLPIPDISQLINSVVVEEIRNTVQASLLKVELGDYNPLHHEKGINKRLNLLVKESLQFGAIIPKTKGNSEPELDLKCLDDQLSFIPERELPQTTNTDNTKQVEEDKTSSIISEEWERLIVNEFGVVMHSPTSNPNSKPVATSPSQNNNNNKNNRKLDEKTSRILERLEIPRQLKRKPVSPKSTDACQPAKKPLIPYKSADVGPISSQPLKPSFQRIKRKT